MSMLKEKIEEIKSDIKDVFDLDFSFSDTKSVPSLQDSTLTYEKGNIKKGKTIYTCVLFVDIRDSVNLNAILSRKSSTFAKEKASLIVDAQEKVSEDSYLLA